MSQKGISREVIVAKAVELIEKSGNPVISMRSLASELGIKASSLYNHVKSVEELTADVSRIAASELRTVQFSAIEGKSRDEALCALAEAYREFAKERRGLYKVIYSLPSLPDNVLNETAAAIAEPIFKVLSMYGLDGERIIHWQRVLRSIIHGFAAQEEAGFFKQSPSDIEVSYHLAIECFLLGIKRAGGMVDA